MQPGIGIGIGFVCLNFFTLGGGNPPRRNKAEKQSQCQCQCVAASFFQTCCIYFCMQHGRLAVGASILTFSLRFWEAQHSKTRFLVFGGGGISFSRLYFWSKFSGILITSFHQLFLESADFFNAQNLKNRDFPVKNCVFFVFDVIVLSQSGS